MRDKIAERRVREARDRFIQSINENDILRLASTHNNGKACTFFKPPVRGTYNVCYFVRFGGSEKGTDEQQQSDGNANRSSGERAKDTEGGDSEGHSDRGKDTGGELWVVRVPLEPYLCIPAHEKVESEVAVMQLIASRTTIPIPKVHAYSIAREKGPFGVASYMILEYVQGTLLLRVDLDKVDESRLRNLYTQLADIFLQLRRFEFPAIGRLAPSSSGGVEAKRRPISNSMNLQVVEGLRPLEIMDEYCHDGVLTSANDYVSMLLRIAWNAYIYGKTRVSNNEEAGEDIFNLDMFSTFAKNIWLDPALDKGPFVLDHGDLGCYNVIVDEKTLDILAILDWEWSRAIPRQFFVPPTWLSGQSLGIIALYGYFYREHVKRLNIFRTILGEREQKLYRGRRLLSDEWAHIHEKAGILIPPALENWTFIDQVAARYLDRYLGGRLKDRSARVKALLAARPDYRIGADNKIRDTVVYRAQLQELGIDSDSEDGEKE